MDLVRRGSLHVTAALYRVPVAGSSCRKIVGSKASTRRPFRYSWKVQSSSHCCDGERHLYQPLGTLNIPDLSVTKLKTTWQEVLP